MDVAELEKTVEELLNQDFCGYNSLYSNELDNELAQHYGRFENKRDIIKFIAKDNFSYGKSKIGCTASFLKDYKNDR